ncbi:MULTISPECIES: sugar kinase [unclassified Phaeobacter]|uniref:sugar kinase n=1 Tax=unclassified Phaeobacter TaxID=2621772 RepID=UPI003A83D44A
MTDLVCLGEPLIEFNQKPDGQLVMGYGGDVSNVAIAAARQGTATSLISRLGDDRFGQALLELWHREHVDSSLISTVADGETGLYFVFHDDLGHHFLYRRRHSAASRMTPDDLPTHAIGTARIFYASGINLGISSTMCATTYHAVRTARASNVTTAFDPNLRTALWSLEEARAVTHDLMRHVDIALPGLDDARQLTGRQSPDEIIRFYHNLGARIVALTLGRDGVAVSENQGVTFVPGAVVESVDATGAGDCFNGIFLSELLRHGDSVRAAEHANLGAALSTTGYGAVAPIPHRPTLQSKEGRPT